jgi:hypothetical protein
MNHTQAQAEIDTLYQYDILAHPDPQVRRVVDELVYRSYRFNRGYDPSISPERWAHPRAFGPQAIEFEKRYQRELLEKAKGAA